MSKDPLGHFSSREKTGWRNWAFVGLSTLFSPGPRYLAGGGRHMMVLCELQNISKLLFSGNNLLPLEELVDQLVDLGLLDEPLVDVDELLVPTDDALAANESDESHRTVITRL